MEIRIHPYDVAHESIHIIHFSHKTGITVRTHHLPAMRPHPLSALVAPV
uniref:RHC1A n=1 Tax=Arundo donax TaxID=35708 RepID=A0A0A9EUT6_ARUDO